MVSAYGERPVLPKYSAWINQSGFLPVNSSLGIGVVFPIRIQAGSSYNSMAKTNPTRFYSGMFQVKTKLIFKNCFYSSSHLHVLSLRENDVKEKSESFTTYARMCGASLIL
ncbi:hypothetical protein TNCV_3715131 [Trichonephila clavipes]|nr:hypothetical protein TNCV_3715131 [Trichonephila clavipes]